MDGDIQISEKKLEDFFYDHLTGKKPVANIPFDTLEDDCVYRQFDLGSYGIADIITLSIDYDGSVFVEIIEFKKDKITKDSLIQILRYKKGIEFFFRKNNIPIASICCFLVGRRVSYNDGFGVAASTIDFLSIYEYGLDPCEGITIELQERIFKIQKLPIRTKKILSSINYLSSDQECKLSYHEKVK